jgi:hypothetical protein
MSRLKLLSLIALALVYGLALADATDENNLKKLKDQITGLFGEGPEDVFSIALRKLIDYKATDWQIEKIVGNQYSTVENLWKEVVKFAGLIVIAPMKTYQKAYMQTNPSAVRVFEDFYDMILVELDPETIGINRELYIILEIVDEESFTEVYTRLVQFYQRYIPLRDYINKEKTEMMNRIKRLVDQKNPQYKPSTIDPFPNTTSSALEPVIDLPEEKTPPPRPRDPFSSPKSKTVLAYENVKSTDITVLSTLGTCHEAIVKGIFAVVLAVLVC